MGKEQKRAKFVFFSYMWMTLGAFLAALSIRAFLYPNHLIDGGIVGISLILGRLTNDAFISIFIILLNLPFVYLAFRHIRKNFVIQMTYATILFAIFLGILDTDKIHYAGDSIEIIALGGAILGIGAGLIIRSGGCLDGSEILGIIVNKRTGFTVGQVVLVFNIFVFGLYGLLFFDWHIAVKSLLTYIVAFKMIDLVIVGLEELKAVQIISQKSTKVAEAIMERLGLGLTITLGKGGFSKDEREILNVVVERLDLSDLKELILNEDPAAFISVTNIYEVQYGRKSGLSRYKKHKRNISLF